MSSNINKIGMSAIIAGQTFMLAQPGFADELLVDDDVIVVPRTTVLQRPVIVREEVPVIKQKRHWFRRHRDRVSYRLPFVNVDKFDDDHVVIDAPFVHVEADD